MFHQPYGSDKYFTKCRLRACGNSSRVYSECQGQAYRESRCLMDDPWEEETCVLFVEEVEGAVFKKL